jgi:hypothetical protein
MIPKWLVCLTIRLYLVVAAVLGVIVLLGAPLGFSVDLAREWAGAILILLFPIVWFLAVMPISATLMSKSMRRRGLERPPLIVRLLQIRGH